MGSPAEDHSPQESLSLRGRGKSHLRMWWPLALGGLFSSSPQRPQVLTTCRLQMAAPGLEGLAFRDEALQGACGAQRGALLSIRGSPGWGRPQPLPGPGLAPHLSLCWASPEAVGSGQSLCSARRL